MYTDDLNKLIKKSRDVNWNEKYTTIKLPCCGSSIEVQKAADQFIQCPNKSCRKRHALMWSLKPKLKTEGQKHAQRLDW